VARWRLVVWVIGASVLTGIACGRQPPPRIDELDPARVAEIAGRDGLRTEALELWFDDGGRPAYRFEVSGAEALAWWRQLRGLVDATGYWPVVLGSPDNAEMVSEMHAFDDFGPADLEPGAAAAFDLARWRSQRAAAYAEWGDEPHGPWLELGIEPSIDFTVDTDILSGQLLPTVVIGLVPTTSSWQVPLILKYGGWNECPPPMVHAAILRDWERRFGAELVALTGDVVELAVARPPTDREPALELAREQYLYCGDIVWQGTNDLETLAAGLKGGSVWFFWWD
jgi:hypothetical protein